MIDMIIVMTIIEVLVVYLLEFCDCLNFATMTSILFFFALVLSWFARKWENRNE